MKKSLADPLPATADKLALGSVSHFNIDKDGAVQGMVMRDIQAALASSPHKSVACDAHAHTCAAAKPGLVTIGTPIRE
jgi:hypothetical protein